MALALAGLTADARSLYKFMRAECLHHRYLFESAPPLAKIVTAVGDKNQKHTQVSGRRPFGMGLLVAGVDSTGAHLFEVAPSGEVVEYEGQAIGGRSQSARTYLERTSDSWKIADESGLIKHAVRALKETAGKEALSVMNFGVAVVANGGVYRRLDTTELQGVLDSLSGDDAVVEGSGGDAAVPMEVE